MRCLRPTTIRSHENPNGVPTARISKAQENNTLTFDPPSYRSCLMVLRLCVERYGRLPTAITVDGGPEFQSVYFEQLLALYRVRKHQRPAAEPRFGSPQERLFGTMETEFLYHLLGNTQATRDPRVLTKATDPEQIGR